jgi:diamine N-acetyltransferase
MELLIEHVRRRPMAAEFVLSYVAGDGSPEGFYRGLGFEPTGEEIESEVLMGLRVTNRSGKTIQ